MFIVTPAGVIATDPIGERRPQAKTYIEEIQKVTKAPIKYVIYSHSHFDHIAGGKPFKDLGATFIAHKNAKARMPAAQARRRRRCPTRWSTARRPSRSAAPRSKLNWVGKNHSDNTLVMRLPKEKIIFTVDWIPIQGVQFRGMADTYLPDIEDGLKKVIAMDWDRMIPGHPGPGGRLGTKDDASAHLGYLQDLSAAVKKAVDEGKSYADAQKEIKLPKYEKLGRLRAFLPMNIERYYDFVFFRFSARSCTLLGGGSGAAGRARAAADAAGDRNSRQPDG